MAACGTCKGNGRCPQCTTRGPLAPAQGHPDCQSPTTRSSIRALAIQTLAGQPVTMITYDTGQSTRARAASLRVKKFHTVSSGIVVTPVDRSQLTLE
jgi:hypothetical protein